MGWVRKGVIIFLAVIAVVAIVLGRELLVNATPVDTSWMNSGFTVLGSANTRAPWYESIPCAGREEVVSIAGIGSQVQGCVYGTAGELQVARFVSVQWQAKFAVRYPYEEQFHEIRGLCVGMALCMYSPSTDTFIGQYSLPVYRYGAAVYTNFSAYLERHFDPALLVEYYNFTPDYEPEVIALGLTQPTVGAMAFSDNGQWAVLEVHEYGLIRLNMATMEIRRISWPGYTYGHGYDPLFEVAISNDGRFIAAAGRGVGLNMYEITSVCGLAPEAGYYAGVNMGIEDVCPVASPDLVAIFGDLASTHMPRFSSDGSRLSISTRMANNTTRRVLLGAGEPQQLVPYIALGDSFTSGEGETDDVFYKTRTNSGVYKCHTSTRSYPYLVAIEWGVASESVACSGARTLDVVRTGEYFGQNERLSGLSATILADERADALTSYTPGVVRQVDFVSKYTPRVVSIGIGGNDVGMIDKLKACLALTTCDWARDPKKRLAAGKEIQQLYGTLRSTISALKQASPSTAILLVGYPRVINEQENAVCDIPTGMMFDATERRFMDETIILLNSVVRQVALAEGVYYGNVEDSFMGYRLCEATATPAMNAIRFGDDFGLGGVLANVNAIGAESFHPTPFGHELIASALKNQTWWPMGVVECSSCEYTQVDELSAYWGEAEAEIMGPQVSARLVPDVAYSPGEAQRVAIPIKDTQGISRVVVTQGEDTIVDVTLDATLPVIIIPSVTSGFYLFTVQTHDIQGRYIEFYQTVTIQDASLAVVGEPEVVAQQNEGVRFVPAVISVLQAGAPPVQQAGYGTQLVSSASASVLGSTSKEVQPINSETSTVRKATAQGEYYPSVYIYVLVAVASGGILLCIWWIISKMAGG